MGTLLDKKFLQFSSRSFVRKTVSRFSAVSALTFRSPKLSDTCRKSKCLDLYRSPHRTKILLVGHLPVVECPIHPCGPQMMRYRHEITPSSRPHSANVSLVFYFIVSVDFHIVSLAMVCRVCLLHVKKSAVLCAQCSLICHSKCTDNAPPTCDLRAQLLLYAQYAEKGNPSSAYSNPADILGNAHPKSPMSDVAFVSHTPRTSLDTAPPQVPPSPSPASAVHPPVAFKFMNFKRPKVGHPPTDPAHLSSSPSLENMARKPTVLRKAHDDRAPSVKSSSTQANSSMRSAGTVASASGNSEGVVESDARASRVTSQSGPSDNGEIRMPGELSDTNRQHRKNKSSNNCIVQ